MKREPLNCEAIHQRTEGILEKVGMTVSGLPSSPDLAAALSKAGLEVDGNRVRFPRAILKELVDRAPREFQIHRPDGIPVKASRHQSLVMTDATGIFILEPGGITRPPTAKDVHFSTVLQNNLANYDIVRPLITSRDYGEWGDLADFFVMLAAVKEKPICHRTINPGHAQHVMELARIAASDHGHDAEKASPLAVIYCTKSPLSIAVDNIRSIVTYSKYNTPVFLLTMPLAGASAPFGILGPVLMANAELLGAIAIIQCLCPGLPVVYGSEILLLDMRSSYAAFGAPEYQVSNTRAMELAEYYGLPSLCGAGGTDSKELDAQLGFEKACSYLQAFDRAHVLFGIGATDSAYSYYIPCLVLDDELIGMTRELKRLGSRVEDLDELADLIEEVGPDSDFLATTHTFRHCREFWQTQLFSRIGVDNWRAAGSPSIRERVEARAQEIYRGSPGIAVSPAALEEMRTCFKKVTGMEPPL